MKSNISMEDLNERIENIIINNDELNTENSINIGIESFNDKFKEAFDKIGKNNSLPIYQKKFKELFDTSSDKGKDDTSSDKGKENSPRIIANDERFNITKIFKRINSNTFSILFDVDTFINCNIFIKNGIKRLYNDIYIINKLNDQEDDVSVHIFCSWNTESDINLFLTYPSVFLNLLSNEIKANKIGYLDSTNDLFGYYFLSKCNKIVLGEFGSVIINKTQYLNDYSSNIIPIIEDLYQNIFSDLSNKGLITAEEIAQLNDKNIKPVLLDYDKLKSRIDMFNAQ